MLRRLLALVLLTNAVAVVPNLPRILAAVDGEGLGEAVGGWAVGTGTAAGDLVEDVAAGAPDPDEVLVIQDQVRSGELDSPLQDESLAELALVWRLLQAAGDGVDVAALADALGLTEEQVEAVLEAHDAATDGEQDTTTD